MRTRWIPAFALCVASCATSGQSYGPSQGPPSEADTVSVRTSAGARQVHGGGWEGTSDLFVWNWDVSGRPEGWPLGIEAGLQFLLGGEYHDDEYSFDNDPYQTVTGVSLGLYRRWTISSLVFDLGGGIEWQVTEREELVGANFPTTPGFYVSDDDNWWGGYARASLGYALLDNLWIGVEVRGSFGGGPTLFDEKRSGDALQETFVIGFTF